MNGAAGDDRRPVVTHAWKAGHRKGEERERAHCQNDVFIKADNFELRAFLIRSAPAGSGLEQESCYRTDSPLRPARVSIRLTWLTLLARCLHV